MSITHVYPVSLKWDSQRQGVLSSQEVTGQIKVATPPEFEGGMPGIWSPEHLFVAAISSCLMTTFLAIAANSKLLFLDFTCEATGKLEMTDGKYRISEVTLRPVVTLIKADDKEKAERVLAKAEANCLVSNSVNSKIFFEPQIEVAKSLVPG